jgi:hypothetical protein
MEVDSVVDIRVMNPARSIRRRQATRTRASRGGVVGWTRIYLHWEGPGDGDGDGNGLGILGWGCKTGGCVTRFLSSA